MSRLTSHIAELNMTKERRKLLRKRKGQRNKVRMNKSVEKARIILRKPLKMCQ
jgi:hypothetical protein